MTKFLAKIVAWITAGYPEGVPGPDRVPLFALLQARLTDDEVKAVAKELMDRGEFDHVDIGVLITQITDELPDARGRRAGARPPGRQGLAARRPARRRGDANSRPAPRRRPVWRVGAVGAARWWRTCWPARGGSAAGAGRRRSAKLAC